jgi:hypothetical protein
MQSVILNLRYALHQVQRKSTYVFAVTGLILFACATGAVGFQYAASRAANVSGAQHAAGLLQLQTVDSLNHNATSLFAYPEFLDFRAQSNTMHALAAFSPVTTDFQYGETSHSVSGMKSSSAIFKVLDVKPVLGRTFIEEDEQHASEPVVVISNEMWKQQFGGASDTVGRKINLDGKLFTVVGVLPRFEFAFTKAPPAFWVPLDPKGEIEQQRSVAFLQVIARLNPDASIEEATAEIHEIALREGIGQSQKEVGGSVSLVQIDNKRNDNSVAGGIEFPAKLSLITFLPFAMLGGIVFLSKWTVPLKKLPSGFSKGAFQVLNSFIYSHKAAPVLSKLAASLILLAGVMVTIRDFIRTS